MTNTQEHRYTQFALFEQHPASPHWDDLSESARAEIVQHLALLLESAQQRRAGRALYQGGQDERED